jgi:hypothetical protein
MLTALTGGALSVVAPPALASAASTSTSYFTAQGIGALTVARYGAAAAPLSNGDVLIVGGSSGQGGVLATAEVFDPSTQTFTATAGSMTTPRLGAAAAPLPDGDVLIAGGSNAGDAALSSAEVYDPATGTFTATTGTMSVGRNGPIAARLPDGDVLIAGGNNAASPALSSAEVYDPATGMFTPTTASMTTGRTEASAAPLPNGDVLIAGGAGAASFLSSAEVFDPSTQMFTATAGSMITSRDNATAAPLPDGDVLVSGGNNASTEHLSSAELYDSATGRFTATASMANGQTQAAAAPLPNGEVLIAGGEDSNGALSSAEVFVPAAEAGVTGGAFGDVVTGQPSAQQTITVTNLGAQALSLSGAGLTGAQAGDFAIDADGCGGETLAFDQTCTITAQFTPSMTGAESTTLTLADNEATPGTLTLTGTGTSSDTGPSGAVGPTGPPGTTGVSGDPGTAGAPGPTGASGASGPSGPAGASGAVGAGGATGPAGTSGASGASGSLSFQACPDAGGSIHGRTVGKITLGETRAAAEAAYGNSTNRGLLYQDFLCLSPIGIRVGYPSPALLGTVPARERAAYRGRVIWISTSNREFALDGIHVGDTLADAAAHLHLEPVFTIGLNRWYLTRRGGVTDVLKVRRGAVEEVGLADAQLTLTRTAQRSFLTSFA